MITQSACAKGIHKFSYDSNAIATLIMLDMSERTSFIDQSHCLFGIKEIMEFEFKKYECYAWTIFHRET